jgi:hypothetical protein
MLPRAIANALQLPKLGAAEFAATKFDTAEVKVKFGNHLLRFIAEDHPRSLWTQVFYNRLSMTFSHIAEYNSGGFWNTWFATTADHVGFLQNIATHPCWGDPAYTYSDIEKVIKARVLKSRVIAWKEKVRAKERKNQDLAELARLKSIYETSSLPASVPLPAALAQKPAQIDLFS